MLHANFRGSGSLDILGYTVNREAGCRVPAGQVSLAVIGGLLLGIIGTAADVSAAFRIDRRIDVFAVRIQQIPVICTLRQFNGTGSRIARDIRDLKFGVTRIGRRSGRGNEHTQSIILSPLGGHAVIDGTGLSISKDDFNSLPIETGNVGFLITADEGKGGGSQTRKEK